MLEGLLGLVMIAAIVWIWTNGLFPLLLVIVIGAALWFIIGPSVKEKIKRSGNNHTQNKNSKRSSTFRTLSVQIVDGKSYIDYLNELENIAYFIIKEHQYIEIPLYVGIHKTDSNFCTIDFNLWDLPTQVNYTFGSGFSSGEGFASIRIERATNFSTPELVKDEIILQFDWPSIPRRIESLSIMNRGAYQETPLISINFVFGPAQN